MLFDQRVGTPVQFFASLRIPSANACNLSCPLHPASQVLCGSTADVLRLHVLHVAFSQLTESQLAAALQSMPHLRTLIIGHCDAIGDEGLSTLTAFNTELRHLQLVNCGVTDAALLDIAAKLERLSTLNVSQCGGVSAEGAAAVRSQLGSDTPDLLPWQHHRRQARHG